MPEFYSVLRNIKRLLGQTDAYPLLWCKYWRWIFTEFKCSQRQCPVNCSAVALSQSGSPVHGQHCSCILILGQWPSGQAEALLQRPDREWGGHVLQRGTGLRAADLGKGFSDGHFPGGGEDTGVRGITMLLILHTGSTQPFQYKD